MIAVRREFACEVLTAQLFKTPTIAGLAAALQHACTDAEEVASIVPRASLSAQERAVGVPCSANQEQMLVLHSMQPDSSAYNMANATRLRGKLNVTTLECALAFLARRHETLRTHFVERDSQVLQAVYPTSDPRAAPMVQRQSLPSDGAEDVLTAMVEELAGQPFQLIGAGVPMRIVLIAVGQDDHVLFVGNHHILR